MFVIFSPSGGVRGGFFKKNNYMELIDGKKIAAEIKQEIAAKVAELKSKGGKIPHLAAILVGHDGGSETCCL